MVLLQRNTALVAQRRSRPLITVRLRYRNSPGAPNYHLKDNQMKLLAAALVLCSVSSASYATEVALTGVWSNQSGCEWLEAMADNPNGPWPDDFADINYLDATGIKGYEWGCKFIDGKADSNGKMITQSDCSMEGDNWKETLTVEPFEHGWKVYVTDPVAGSDSLYFDIKCLSNN